MHDYFKVNSITPNKKENQFDSDDNLKMKKRYKKQQQVK